MSASFKLLSESEYVELNAKLDHILFVIEGQKSKVEKPLGKWISEKEAQEMTGKKATTLWKMRIRGHLEFTKINNKVFYSRDSILTLMENNKQSAFRA